MARLVLEATKKITVPSDEVYFEVNVDLSRCAPADPAISNRLGQLRNDGITVPISQIVAYAGKHYFNAAEDSDGVKSTRGEIGLAWSNLAGWRPRPEKQPGKSNVYKLVLDDRENTRQKSHISEILGVGVGLILAARVYVMPYRFWYPDKGNAATDYRAPGVGGGDIQVEVRGRFGHANWGEAIAQVHRKLGVIPSLSSQLGVIFAPRTSARTLVEDVLLVDPDGPGAEQEDNAPYRALLRHYAPFFGKQNFHTFAGRLLELADLLHDEFELYLQQGDAILRSAIAHRTSFNVGAYRFEGTAWRADAVPLLPPSTEAYVIWGLWDAVIEALRNGQLSAIAEAELNEWSSKEGDFSYSVLADGTAFAWAETLDLLTSMP